MAKHGGKKLLPHQHPKFTKRREETRQRQSVSKERKIAYHEATLSVPPRRPLIGGGWRGLKALRFLRRAGKALVHSRPARRRQEGKLGSEGAEWGGGRAGKGAMLCLSAPRCAETLLQGLHLEGADCRQRIILLGTFLRGLGGPRGLRGPLLLLHSSEELGHLQRVQASGLLPGISWLLL